MPLNVNTNNIPNGGNLYLNGVKLSAVTVNVSNTVWEYYTPGFVELHYSSFTTGGSGDGTVVKIQDGDYRVTPPPGITKVSLCASGGGGSGAEALQQNTYGGGGYAGDSVQVPDLTVVDGNTIIISLGKGGSGSNPDHSGKPGEKSMFDSMNIYGGDGGVINSGYQGNGAAKIGCTTTSYDGLLSAGAGDGAYGGEASIFSNGGNGGYGVSPGAGVDGGGGGGGFAVNPGNGGDGAMRISW